MGTSIEWTGPKGRTLKMAATRVGVRPDTYAALIAEGLKWCGACRCWHPRSAFGTDLSRGDGLAARCSAARHARTTAGPGVYQRRCLAARGLAWCSGCRRWLPLADVDRGACRAHANERYRQYYAERGAAAIRQRVHGRKRGVAPVPPIGQEILMEDFDGLCAYCTTEPATTWDHVYPISKGGETKPGNVVPACASCNSSKRDRTDLFAWMRERGVIGHVHMESVLALGAMN